MILGIIGKGERERCPLLISSVSVTSAALSDSFAVDGIGVTGLLILEFLGVLLIMSGFKVISGIVGNGELGLSSLAAIAGQGKI